MKSGIEVAFQGFAAKPLEMRRSKAGKDWGLINLGTETGALNEDESAVIEWIRVSVFGQTAQDLAGRIDKGTKIYVEGWLKIDRYTPPGGELRISLSVAANKPEITGAAAIGRNKPRADHRSLPDYKPQTEPRQVANALTKETTPAFMKHTLQKPVIPGLTDERDYWRDEIPL
jgi:single-stranded DNA-binding protein